MVDTPTVQKVLIIGGLFMCTISDGYIIGQLSGMVAAQQSDGGDVLLDDTEMSWVASASNITTLLGLAVAALVTDKFGRRKAITILTLPVLASWLAVYLAKRMIVFMIARIILGLCFGGVLSLCVISTAEYTAPNVRGFYLNMIVTAGASVGVSISNILGILLHWRTVAWVGMIPATISAILPFFWVESPAWLASKGRFKECAEAFTKLHGTGKAANTELQLLIKVEMNNQSEERSKSMGIVFKKLFAAIKHKYMLKIAGLCVSLHLYRVATCRLLMCSFTVTILENVTGSSHILLFTLIADGCMILGSFMSCFLIDRMKMRTLLLIGGVVSNLTLIALCISMYYFDAPWVNCALLGLFQIIINAGPYPILESLFGEIYPLKIKGYCMVFFGVIGTVLLFVSVRYALPLFEIIGYHGTFLMNAILGFLCLAYFWIFLPETKGRTLQEIELYFKNNVFEEIEDLLNDERIVNSKREEIS